MIFSENHHVVPVILPDADALAGTKNGDVIDVKDFSHVAFYLIKGVGATGTQTLTVEACDDTTPSNATAIPFKYRVGTTIDTYGDLQDATASGFTTTAGSNQVYIIEVEADALASLDRHYIRIVSTEVVDAACDAAVFAVLSGARYASKQFDSVID